MGFRIVGRRERTVKKNMELLRQALLEAEAERFMTRKNRDDSTLRQDFIDKINNIGQSLDGVSSAQALAERLEASLRSEPEGVSPLFGSLEASAILDLL